MFVNCRCYVCCSEYTLWMKVEENANQLFLASFPLVFDCSTVTYRLNFPIRVKDKTLTGIANEGIFDFIFLFNSILRECWLIKEIKFTWVKHRQVVRVCKN